jgi:hypothetical protein
MAISEILDKIVGKNHVENAERVSELRSLLPETRSPPQKPKDFVRYIAQSFCFDSLTVSKKNGSVLLSTEENGLSEAEKLSSLYRAASGSMPKTKMLSLRDNDKYNIIYPDGDLLYIMRTPGEVSPLEIRRMIQKLNSGIASLSPAKKKP